MENNDCCGNQNPWKKKGKSQKEKKMYKVTNNPFPNGTNILNLKEVWLLANKNTERLLESSKKLL